MVANNHPAFDEQPIDENSHGLLCALVLEALDELDYEDDGFADAVNITPETISEFLVVNPKWARVVRDVVQIKLYEFDVCN